MWAPRVIAQPAQGHLDRAIGAAVVDHHELRALQRGMAEDAVERRADAGFLVESRDEDGDVGNVCVGLGPSRSIVHTVGGTLDGPEAGVTSFPVVGIRRARSTPQAGCCPFSALLG